MKRSKRWPHIWPPGLRSSGRSACPIDLHCGSTPRLRASCARSPCDLELPSGIHCAGFSGSPSALPTSASNPVKPHSVGNEIDVGAIGERFVEEVSYSNSRYCVAPMNADDLPSDDDANTPL
jgi:hypothetical protein